MLYRIAGEKDCLFVTDKKETANFLPVNSCVVNHVHFSEGYPQKKCVNPGNGHHQEIKYVNNVSCVLFCFHQQLIREQGVHL